MSLHALTLAMAAEVMAPDIRKDVTIAN
jgi:hypothetical protein